MEETGTIQWNESTIEGKKGTIQWKKGMHDPMEEKYEVYAMWLPSLGKTFLLIWKILLCTNFLNKINYVSYLNNSKILTFWTFNSFKYPLLICLGLSPCVCTLFSYLFHSLGLVLARRRQGNNSKTPKVHNLFPWFDFKCMYSLVIVVFVFSVFLKTVSRVK